MRKRLFRLLLIAALLVLLRAALSDREVKGTETTGAQRTVIGADLNEEEIAAVYNGLGVERGSVTELRMTNSEERLYLQNGVDTGSIGTRTVSCVYMELLPSGSGLDIRTSNIAWTAEMYASALATAGITDARIVVAAPFPVTGTGALAGIYKAYEDMTGKRLSDESKSVGTQELSLLGELARQVGTLDSTALVREIKQLLDQSRELTDWELRAEMLQVASRLHVTLTETQLEQLVSLCRSLEGLDTGALQERVDGLQSTLQRVSETKERAAGFFTVLGETVRSIRELIHLAAGLFR